MLLEQCCNVVTCTYAICIIVFIVLCRLPSFGCQPSPVQCQSVESAIGCQDVTLPSTSTQCVMEDDVCCVCKLLCVS